MAILVAIKDRAFNKAWSKIVFIELELSELKVTKPIGAYTQDMINGQIRFKNRELQTWEYIIRKIS